MIEEAIRRWLDERGISHSIVWLDRSHPSVWFEEDHLVIYGGSEALASNSIKYSDPDLFVKIEELLDD